MLTPLGMKDSDGGGGFMPAAPSAPEPKKETGEGLDAAIDRAFDATDEKLEAERARLAAEAAQMPILESLPSDTPLDKTISVAMAAKDVADTDRKSFIESRAMRDELVQRTGAKDIGQILTRFVELDGSFRKNPAVAADMFAQLGLMFRYGEDGLIPRHEDAEKETRDPNEHHFKRIDRSIDKAFDEADAKRRDDTDFTATKQLREQFKKQYPGVDFQNTIRRLLTITRDWQKDPIGTAERLSASYGLPVTPLQQANARAVQDVQAQIAFASNTVNQFEQNSRDFPRFPELRETMAWCVSHPDWPASGDHAADLALAYKTAEHIKRFGEAGEQRRAAVAKAQRALGGGRGTGSQPGFNSNKLGLDGAIESAINRVA